MLRAALLFAPAVLAASPMAALAQNATWLANPATNQFNSAGNWTAGIPTGTATFGAASTTAISLAPGGVTVGGFQFDPGAPAYSFTGTSGLTFNGAGIVNNSASAPAISMTGASIAFTNAASGGNARLILNPGASLNISGLTSAGTSVGSIEGAGNVNLGAKQLTTGGNDLSTTLSGVISGSGGALAKEGGGTLTLTGANTYSGGTTVSGGTLAIGAGGTTGTIAGNIANNATLLFNRSDTLTIAGTISGSGGVIQEGAGTTHLTANNTFSGTTTISAGTLQLGSTQASGATTGALGSGDVVNNAALRVHRQNASTIAGNISGTGTLTNTGVGTVTLLGNNSYSGTTTITSGTVQVGNGGTAGALGTGNVVNNSAFTGLLFNRSDTITVANSISGTGNLSQGGSGTTILTGTNSYANTTVGSGTLQIGDGGTAGNLGTGSVTNNGTLAFNRSDDITLSNAISGSGSLSKLGTNTLILTGNNTSTGGTTISGGTLQAGNGGTTGGIGSGATTNNGSLVFNRSNNLVVSSAISGSGTLTKLGAGTIELSGNNSYTGTTTISAGTLSIGRGGATGTIAGDIVNNAQLFIARNNDYTYAGSISGTGSVSTTDAGTTTLTGTNTYTGTTTISGAGVLQIGDGGTTGTLGTGNVVATASTLRFNRSDAVSIANAISGTGNVNHAGSGTTTLTGANSYSGATTISAGMLQIGNGGTTGSLGTGNVTNNATLAFNRSNALTYGGVISGSGALLQSGTGTTTLTGANTYSGGTTISSGTLQIGNGGTTGSLGAGNVANSGTLAVSRSDALTVANAISGTGGLSKLGTNTLTLTGANTYSGTTTIAGGTLQIGNGGTTGALGTGATVNNGVLQFNRSDAMTVSSAISGTGSVVQAGTGTTTLTGNNTYTGTTTVLAGRLQVGTAGASGTLTSNVVNNGTVAFDSSTSTTYGGTISGSGSVVQGGTGTTILTGVNTYTGGTTVSAGRLAINGSIASDVTVGSGGNLGGSGTITGGVTNSGTLAPGNSIGTLNVVGSYTQAAGSVYQVEVNAAGQADRINVTGAPGTATINGGTVQVIAEAGSYSPRTTYTILNATGGVTGTYSTVTSNFAFLTPSLSYDANNVFLTLLLSQNAFADGARTANQRAVGGALDRVSGSASGDFSTAINALAGLSTAQGPGALDAISGQQYSGFGTANMSSGLLFMNAVGQQMSAARGASGGGTRAALAQACDVACDGEGPSPWSVWVSALGGTGSVAGNSNTSTLTYNNGGAATGIDYRVDPRLLVGMGLGVASGNQWTNGFNSRGTSNSYQASAYASFTPGAFYIDALAGYAYNDNQMTRMIQIPGLQTRTATGRTGASQLLGQAEAGYKVDIYQAAAASLTPFVRLQASSINQAGFSESGANSLSLNVAQQATSSVRSVLGVELAGAVDAGWREKLALQFRLGWAHEYADTSRPVTAAFAGAPGSSFTVQGAAQARDSALIGLAANTAIAQGTSLYLRYDGEVGTGSDSHMLSAGIRLTW